MTRPSPLQRLRATLGATLAVLLGVVLLAGCDPNAASGPDTAPSSSTSRSAEFPREVTIPAGVVVPEEQTVSLAEKPSSIILLAPAVTETVYAIGAGDQVVAVDKLSNYPDEAKTTDLDAFTPNVEAIAGMEPDLVLLSNDQGGIVAQLEALDIPVAVLEAPATLDQAYAQFALVGELTGNEQAATELADSVRDRIEAAVAATEDSSATTYYWELDPTYYSVTSQTFAGALLGEFGLTSIADDAPGADEAGGYPQLSAEFILDADPDLIFAPGGDADAIRKRSGWDVIRAVKDTDGVVVLDNDIASRWGPRIADLAEQISQSLVELQ